MTNKRKRLSRFDKSQRAHERLIDYHLRNKGTKSSRLHGYHVEVYNTQKGCGTILSRKERKKIYNFWVKHK